jgi:hypothetical protein
MTTTKKKAKAKRNPWPPWIDALDDVREVLKAVERRAMDESMKSNARITALEQAHRPPTWSQEDIDAARTRAGELDRLFESVPSEENMSDEDIESDMRRRGEDPVVVAQRMRKSLDGMLEESRLRDAVVDAALAWLVAPGGVDADDEPLVCAAEALRAHRAKKGGA